MSREAVNRVVKRIMKDPTMQAKGVSEESARSQVARAAERSDRMYGPPQTPLSPEEHAERADGVRPNLIRSRAAVDKDSELHYDLSHADGTAPPRVGLHGRVTDGGERIRGMHDSTNQRLKEMLERG